MKIFLKKIAGYSFLLIALNFAIGYWLKSYESVDLKKAGVFFSELRWDDYYNLKKPIDVLILGSSHAFRSYHPETIRKATGTENEVFNFGSAAQTPVTSYFLLNEVLENHRPKMLVFDLYVMVFTSDDQLDNGRINFHPMKTGEAKMQFLTQGFSLAEKANLLLFPVYVYRDHFKHKVNKLLGRTYLPTGKGQYEKNGFAFNQDTLSREQLANENQFSRFEIDLETVTEKNILYLEKIATRCREENIPLIFMSSPMPELSVSHIKNYKVIHDFFNEKAEALGVRYVDFNINRIPELNDTRHFYDDDHLNLEGAKILSRKVGEFIDTIAKAEK